MKPLQNYSFIRGVNYDHITGEEIIRRDLGYAARIGLNSIRVWLVYRYYRENPEAYMDKLLRFMRSCGEANFTVMPILFNGNGLDPAFLEESFLSEGEAYVRHVVSTIKNEPNLIMWDIMNEPPCNDLILRAASQKEKDGWYAKIWRFVRHFCRFVRSLDGENAITVGNWLAADIENSADLVDVISYHDYSPTLRGVREAAELALSMGKKYGKPVINNETCCIARGNPYDTVIQTMDEYGIPWYVFNLMIDGYWSEVHGIFYPDGTIRDPSIVAAVLGCFRNRNLETIVPEKPNREKQAAEALEKLKDVLSDSQSDVFSYGGPKVEELLEICEHMANLLECGQLVAMQIPPTARIADFRKQEKPNLLEIKRFAWNLANQLKEGCQIL